MIDYQEFLKSKRLKDIPTGHEPKEIIGPLFDFQSDITRWAVKRGRAAIWSECGTGKTLMELEWARQVHEYINRDILILAPLAVAQQTKREGEKFGYDVNICRSQFDVRKGINVTNYEMLHKFYPTHFGGVVADESGILKSLEGKIRNQLISYFSHTPYRLACTATAAPNDYMELGHHAEFLGVMSYTEMLSTFFVHNGGSTSQWKLKGHAEGDFWKWLCSWAVMLRKPSDLGYDDGEFILPELRLYQHVVRSDKLPNGMLLPLQAQSLNEYRQCRKATIDDRVKELGRIINSSPESWAVWCELNEESKKATKAINGVEICGNDPIERKEELLMAFIKGDIKRLVSKASICGWGLNLQCCHNVAFLGIGFSFESYYQAVRRFWRFGQKNPVNVHIITSNLDGSVIKAIQRKEADFNRMANEMTKYMADISSKEIKGLTMDKEEYRTDIAEGDGWKQYLGDNVPVCSTIKEESIYLTVFSVPFAELYTYSNSERDMGNSKNYKTFFKHLRYLASELIRITMPGRLCAIHCSNIPSFKYKDGYIGYKDLRGNIIRTFERCKWIPHTEVFIWKNPVVEMQRTKAIGLLYKQLQKDSTLCRVALPEFVLVFRKPGENPIPVGHKPVDFPLDKWQVWASPAWMDINHGNTLQRESAREEKDDKHVCPLSLDIIERCITLWSNPGEVVLDPCSGIGSTGYQALKMKRRFIGIELKYSYWLQAVGNLKSAESSGNQLSLFNRG